MQIKKIIHLGLLIIILASCQQNPSAEQIANWKAEVIATETQFMQMLAKEGIAKAFTHFADDNAVINRADSIIKGKKAINHFYTAPSNKTNIQLVWDPDFVDLSALGDMAYTYGNYTYSFTDTIGLMHSYSGIFHTVWKRNPKGEWKYVYD